MRRPLAIALAALSVFLGACAGVRIESGAVVNPHTIARLDVVGASPDISIHNAGAVALPIEIGWGVATRETDTLIPGVTRWWNPDGPRSFWFINDSDRAIAVTYVVDDADVHFIIPAPK